MADKEAETCSC